MNNLPADKNRRILIIDDNRAIHDDFRKILSPPTIAAAALDATEAKLFGKPANGVQQIRYEIGSAYQGQDGVLLVKQALEAGRPYAMAFVDVRMPPGMDGMETAQKIWELDPDLQVVLCTAYSDYSWGEVFEKLGQHDGLLILKKPFDTVEALQMAHALTEKWWLHRQARQKMEDLEGLVAERTQELAKSLSLLNATLESTADGIVAGDLSGKIILYNTKFADTWQFPAGMLARENAAETRAYVTGQVKDPAIFLQRIKELQANPEAGFHDVIELKDGRTFERYAFPQRVNGECVGVVVNWRDVTERKQAEEKLRKSEERFRRYFELGLIGMAISSPTKGWIEVNDQLCQMFGYERSELLQMSWAELTHPDDLAADLANFNRVIAGEVDSYSINKRFIRKDGRVIDTAISAKCLRRADGSVDYFVLLVQDITERKRMEEALAESQGFFHSLVEQLPANVWRKDAEGRYVFVNSRFCRSKGKTADEILGQMASVINSKEMADQAMKEHELIMRTGKSIEKEEFYTQPDGTVRYLHILKAPVFAAEGRVIGSQGIQFDITERKRLEAQLFQSQKMETVGKLAGGVAHEFNSILTAIIGQSELLISDLPAGSPLAENATEITKGADRAAVLTRQLLAYGRKQFLQPEALNLNQIITSMSGVLGPLMGGEMVDVNIVPAAGLQLAMADAGQIEQVIMNLAMNARDAMPNGGKLTLETANVTLGQEYVSRIPELKPGGYVMLAISDTGTGMSEKVKARVFEPFFTTKGVGQGTGLGLSTCYGIIKQSGGHISVYSEPGRGTTFKIYLPQVEPQTKIPMQPRNSHDLPRGTETILLVEDDPALRELAATLLRRLGYTVLVAANGIEALSLKQQCDTGHVDLLFTDVVMPHMSGKELSERVRALYPHTRVLFTSAYTENAIVHQGVLDKGVALLPKPFTPSALARKVREVLDAPGAPQPAYAGPEPAPGIAGEATARRRPDTAQKTFGFTKSSEEAKAPGN